jgi:hypothetical protein
LLSRARGLTTLVNEFPIVVLCWCLPAAPASTIRLPAPAAGRQAEPVVRFRPAPARRAAARRLRAESVHTRGGGHAYGPTACDCGPEGWVHGSKLDGPSLRLLMRRPRRAPGAAHDDADAGRYHAPTSCVASNLLRGGLDQLSIAHFARSGERANVSLVCRRLS